MIVKGTYFQNDAERPLVYGDVEIRNIPRQRLRGEKKRMGFLRKVCSSDFAEPIIR